MPEANGWSRRFDDPIPLLSGRQLVTLKDAADYIMKLPKAEPNHERAAGAALQPTRTKADFEAWRDHQTFTAWKYRMHDEGLPLPTQRPDGRTRCLFVAPIDIPGMAAHVYAAHTTHFRSAGFSSSGTFAEGGGQ